MRRPATDNSGAEEIKTHAKIGVLGCTGRVGALIIKELQARHFGAGVSLAGGTVRPGLPHDGDFFITEKADELFEMADALIDFTVPGATAKHAWLAAKHHKPLVIGTTGLSPEQEQELSDAAKEAPLVYAANMSVGVNLLIALVEQAASTLGDDFDIEIAETHHKHKIDAPSGTALALGKAAASGRNVDFDNAMTPARHGETGEREKGTIGFAVRRGGDVVGEHTVSFFGEGERIELAHKATDRSLFAKGAIRAALWAKDQPNGLYSMRDVLGF